MPPDLGDNRWIPLSYQANTDSFMFGHLTLELVGDAAFLDQRLGAAWDRRVAVSAYGLPTAQASPHAWLFHTAFCCSTLLARALHDPPKTVVLKEPNVLLDLARISLDTSDTVAGLMDERLRQTIRLLARPWGTDSIVLIKPTNAANHLLPRILDVSSGSRALLLHGSLEEFLVSCIKKLPGAEQPLQWMLQYLLPGTQLERRLGLSRPYALNAMEACVLIWYAQIELYAAVLSCDEDDRLRSLDMGDLLDDPGTAVSAAAAWLHPSASGGLPPRIDHIRHVFSRNAKQTDDRYGPTQRAEDRLALIKHNDALIRAVLAWAHRRVAPVARVPTNWKPLLQHRSISSEARKADAIARATHPVPSLPID